MARSYLVIIGLLFCGVLLVSCGKKQTNSKYTFGPTTQTGTLVSTGVSLLRRGTHVLLVDGQSSIYLESKTINLSEFDEKTVKVEGELEPNNKEEYLPVLVVSSLTPVQSEAVQERSILGLDMTLSVPEAWAASFGSGSALFSIAAGDPPILSVDRWKDAKVPDGRPVLVGNEIGVRRDSDGGAAELFVLHGENTIRIRFTPNTSNLTLQQLARVREQFSSILQSVSFGAKVTSSAGGLGSSIAPTQGQMCGGPAGLLCEPGHYCNITDKASGIGVCEKR